MTREREKERERERERRGVSWYRGREEGKERRKEEI